MKAASSGAIALVAGRYEVHDELARGGMGVVYRAIDRATHRTLALKRSLDEHEATADLSRSMLQREYQTLVTLRHPRIIQVYDFGLDEVGPYYTMELLDGADLRAKCPLPWREVCTYLRDIASSLALLHSRRLLHCDVTVANIRLTSEGRAKLLDFGALASFGRNSIIAGTAPTTAPEVLAGEDLDQRVDLYALGGTAYYALCGQHAYPATSLAFLPTVWAQGRPPAPSKLRADIPRELDELLLSMLDLDRLSRPPSAAEVIDRLGAIAGLAPDDDQRIQRSYLYTTVVGRDSERALLNGHLEQALANRGGGALIEGAPGLGKSFLLEDIAQRARLSGARVLTVNARAQSGASGTWSALLQEAGVVEARGSARAQALEVAASHPVAAASSDAIFLRLAKTRPLVLSVEDLHEADPDSLASFAMLAKSVRNAPVLLLATLDPAHPNADRPALRLLRERLCSLELRPFDEKATHAFVVSLFGDVAAAARLSTFLHNHAAGNPRACTEIIHYLIAQGFIRYAEGTWILPDELHAADALGRELGAIANAAFESRIARWSPALRALALCLSPQRRVFDRELCRVLSEGEPEIEDKRLPQLLLELVREGVLVEDRGSYAFAGSRVRDILYRRLSAVQKQRLHGRLAEVLFATVGSNPSRAFEIGFHYLLAGEDKKARTHINRNVEASLMDPDLMIEAVPDLWALLDQQRSAGASDEDVQFIEGLLATSGYYLDPTTQQRFGERAVVQIRRTVGLELAARLVPWLGRPLAVLSGVLVAWVKSYFRKPYLVSGSFYVSLLFFVGMSVAVGAGACVRLDRRLQSRIFKLLDVTRGLGKLNAFSLLYDCFVVVTDELHGRFAQVQVGLDDQLERLPRIPLITKESQHQYGAGLQFCMGRYQLLRIDSATLRCADRIDALGGKHDRLLALFLRRTYHLYRGDLAAFQREDERFDQMAAQFGSRWVADVVSVLQFWPYHWAHDVLGLKRMLHRIDQLLAIAPDLTTHREIIRAMYEGHRGKPALALAIYAALEDPLTPFAHPAWAAARGHQAECLNLLGRHAEALAICEEAREHLTSADRVYVFAYQQLEREAALALAGLGRCEDARRLLDGLLAECAVHDNPLVQGTLHHDRALVACAARDRAAFGEHAKATERAFSATQNPALIARAKRLFELGRKAGLVSSSRGPEERPPSTAGHLNIPRAARVLEEVVQTTGARSACLYLVFSGRAMLGAHHGDAVPLLSPALEAQITTVARLLDGRVSEQQLQSVMACVERPPATTLVALATRLERGRRQVVGLLVIGDCEKAGALAQLDLVELAYELVETDEATEVT